MRFFSGGGITKIGCFLHKKGVHDLLLLAHQFFASHRFLKAGRVSLYEIINRNSTRGITYALGVLFIQYFSKEVEALRVFLINGRLHQ